MKKVYPDSEQRKVVEIDFLPSKHYTFSVFCPIGRSGEPAESVFDCGQPPPCGA